MTSGRADMRALDPAATARALPYAALADCVREVLLDASVSVPPRIVQPLAGGGSLFVMPASDRHVAITKLITFVPDNPARGLPAIQGDVLVFDPHTGQRLAVLHGPTVTARRTAAVSLRAAMELAPSRAGPLLIVGAGVQGRAHLEAFVQGLGVQQVRVASRSVQSAQALVDHARSLGVQAERVDDPDAAMAECPLVVSCTSAQSVALRGLPRDDAFVCAVGAFTPEWSNGRRRPASTWPHVGAWWSIHGTPTMRPATCSRPAWTSPPLTRWVTWCASIFRGSDAIRAQALSSSRVAGGRGGTWRRPAVLLVVIRADRLRPAGCWLGPGSVPGGNGAQFLVRIDHHLHQAHELLAFGGRQGGEQAVLGP